MTTATPTSPRIATGIANEIATGASDYPPDQHTLGRSILLHLLPGALILGAFLAFYPLTAALGLPALIALLLAVIVAAIPTQLGHLLYQGYRRNGRLSLEGVVVFRQRSPLWQYLLFIPLGIVWSFGWYGALAPVSDWLTRNIFAWAPGWFLRADLATSDRAILIGTLAALLLLNGFIGPIVEEMYFRGYLLPRLARYGKAAPWINLALFTLYHLWQPWLYPTVFVALASLVFPVWWTRNMRIGVYIHCALNLIGGALTVALLLGPH
jgi:membrane protease YdiL (CAAX protease family)